MKRPNEKWRVFVQHMSCKVVTYIPWTKWRKSETKKHGFSRGVGHSSYQWFSRENCYIYNVEIPFPPCYTESTPSILEGPVILRVVKLLPVHEPNFAAPILGANPFHMLLQQTSDQTSHEVFGWLGLLEFQVRPKFCQKSGPPSVIKLGL